MLDSGSLSALVTSEEGSYRHPISNQASPELPYEQENGFSQARPYAITLSLGDPTKCQPLIITRFRFRLCIKARIRMGVSSIQSPPFPSTMQSRLSGYSDFFASGFRAVLLARTNSDQQPTSPTPSTSRLRRLSFSYKRTANKDAKRSKTDSFIEFSSSLTETLSGSKVHDHTPKTKPTSIGRQTEPETPSYENIDPFTSSPDAKSIFIHSFDTTDASPRRSTTKRDSFLSFSDTSLVSVTPKRRPVSMPIPITRHFSWSDEEEETETWTLNLDHLEEEEEDFAHRIDWRQFHVDVLLDE